MPYTLYPTRLHQLCLKHCGQVPSKKGFGLIEVLIAVMTTAIILTGIAILLSMSVRNSAEAKYREEATERSQEILEYLRRYRITEGWDVFSNYINNNDYCLPEGFTGQTPQNWLPDPMINEDDCQYDPDTEMKANFKRILTVSPIDNGQLTVTVTTSWQVGSRERTVTLQRIFTDYQ